MMQHLTPGSVLKDLSTEAKYPKSEKGNASRPTTIHFFSAIFRKHSPKKLKGKHVTNKNRAGMYVKNEKPLLFFFKLSIPV